MINNRSTDQSILFISYHYPPDAKVGAKRIAKLARFLNEKGYKVGVLTVKEKYYELHDYSLCNNNLEIYRTNMFPSLRFMYIGINNFINQLRGSAARGRPSFTPDSKMIDKHISSSIENRRLSRFLGWIKKNILSLVWLPDDRQGWVPFGFAKCLTLVRKYQIIYSSSPPHSVHLIPLLTSILFKNILWVTEFRDPWIAEWKPSFARTRFSDWLENSWKSAVMKRSSKVIVVTKEMKNKLAAEYPQYERKIKVYYNGYDENEFTFIKSTERKESKKVIFAHAGTFYFGRNPKSFMVAVSELILESKINKDDIQIKFFGDICIGKSESIEEYAKLLDVDDIVMCYGYIPNNKCLEELNKADVLLLFSIRQPLQVPAKLYEYLALNKSILSITTGGMTSDLIDITGSGMNVPPDNIPEMKNAIMKYSTSNYHRETNRRSKISAYIRFLAICLRTSML